MRRLVVSFSQTCPASQPVGVLCLGTTRSWWSKLWLKSKQEGCQAWYFQLKDCRIQYFQRLTKVLKFVSQHCRIRCCHWSIPLSTGWHERSESASSQPKTRRGSAEVVG